MRRLAPALIALPLLAAASAPVQPQSKALDEELKRARSEQSAAEARAAQLDRIASKARNEVEKLRAEQAASAQAMEAAEARITAADTQLRIASAYVAAHRRQLAEEQRPVSSLLAGLAVMAQRPPLMALADQASADELVRVRILLGSTLPVIRARTAQISAELEKGRKLERAAALAQAELAGSRLNLIARRQQFAALEQRSLDLAARTGARALTAGDAAIVAGENVEGLQRSESSRRASAGLARQLATLNAAPARPIAPEGQAFALPFEYELPASAAVTEGLAAVNESGVRSRGVSLATFSGAPVTAPARGTVRFSGPFRDYDGVLIIDHGGGWMSLIVNVSSDLKTGEKVTLGQAVGRALGPLQVELSQNGRRISAALIAGSSQKLSNTSKGG